MPNRASVFVNSFQIYRMGDRIVLSSRLPSQFPCRLNVNQSSENTRDCRHCYAIGVRMFVEARSHQVGHFCFKFSLHYFSPCISAILCKNSLRSAQRRRERKVKRVLFSAAERISTNIASAHVDARNVKTSRALEQNY